MIEDRPITPEEIEGLQAGVVEYEPDLPGQCKFTMTEAGAEVLLIALKRLSKLEAAVAFHGFDEVPEGECRWIDIDIRYDNGAVDHSHYDQEFGKLDLSESCQVSWGRMNGAGFTGWRYPVGDLTGGQNENQ